MKRSRNNSRASVAGARGEAAAVEPGLPAAASKYDVLADGSIKRTLVKPIRTHKGDVSEIVLRPPTWDDVMQLGDPKSYIVLDGGYLPQTDMVCVAKYLERLSGIDSALLGKGSHLDALALRDAVLSFF